MNDLFNIIFEEEKNLIVRQFEDYSILFTRKYSPTASCADLVSKAIQYYRQNNFDEALRQIESAIVVDPKSYFNWVIRANILEESKKYLEAIESYKIAIWVSKEVWYSFLYQIGICYLLGGNFLRAKNFINSGIRVRTLLINGEATSIKYKVKNEAEFIEGCVINIPEAKMVANLGSCKYNLNEGDGAIETLSQAIKLDPNYHMPYLLIGLLLVKNNKLEMAKKFLVQAHNLGNPNALNVMKENYLI